MMIEWDDGFTIKVNVDKDTVVVSANKEGLHSLAKQLMALADSDVGSHIHYDEYNSFESGSNEMIIQKIG